MSLLTLFPNSVVVIDTSLGLFSRLCKAKFFFLLDLFFSVRRWISILAEKQIILFCDKLGLFVKKYSSKRTDSFGVGFYVFIFRTVCYRYIIFYRQRLDKLLLNLSLE